MPAPAAAACRSERIGLLCVRPLYIKNSGHHLVSADQE